MYPAKAKRKGRQKEKRGLEISPLFSGMKQVGKNQQPNPQPLPHPLPHPPQQKSKRMIQMQLLLPPQLSLPHPSPLPFPQQQKSKIRMMSQEQLFPLPHPPSHPHPQFVAAKSLISDLLKVFT